MADDTGLRERALVQAGWELVDLLGQLDEGQAWKLLETRWEAERARAAARLKPLATGELMPSKAKRTFEGPSNQTRFVRTLDFVQPGDRVFEIGPGRGYVAGVLLRDGGATAYRAIDVHEGNLGSSRELLELNGLADRSQLTTGSIYDLTRDEVAESGADLVICCEVIEHLPDPELAVKVLAGALPSGTDLLISVPLLGRLERVWGHFAIFEAARVRGMVEAAGLTVHAVSVVDNVWVFVLASHDPGPSPRAARAAEPVLETLDGTLAARGTPTAISNLDLDDLDIGPSLRSEQLARHHIERTAGGVVCELTGATRRPWSRDSGGRSWGGLRIPVTSPRGLRLELAVDPLEELAECFVDAYAGQRRVARWRWTPATSRPAKMPATFVLRPGRSGRFRQVKMGDLAAADAFELVGEVEAGASVRIRVTRVGVIH